MGTYGINRLLLIFKISSSLRFLVIWKIISSPPPKPVEHRANNKRGKSRAQAQDIRMTSRLALLVSLAHFPSFFSLYDSLVRFINGFRIQKKNLKAQVFCLWCPTARRSTEKNFSSSSIKHFTTFFTLPSSFSPFCERISRVNKNLKLKVSRR